MFPHNAWEQMEAAPINSFPVYTSKGLRYIAVKDPFWWSDSLQRIGKLMVFFDHKNPEKTMETLKKKTMCSETSP